MPEASARARHQPAPSASARQAGGGRDFFLLRLLRGPTRTRARVYVGAALAAVMAAIIVNALALQHARHPSPFFAVGEAYWDFAQTSDDQVRDLLRAAEEATSGLSARQGPVRQ